MVVAAAGFAGPAAGFAGPAAGFAGVAASGVAAAACAVAAAVDAVPEVGACVAASAVAAPAAEPAFGVGETLARAGPGVLPAPPAPDACPFKTVAAAVGGVGVPGRGTPLAAVVAAVADADRTIAMAVARARLGEAFGVGDATRAVVEQAKAMMSVLTRLILRNIWAKMIPGSFIH